MTRPRLLDLFSGAGGAAQGYHRAGFDVTGVDIRAQPRYPFKFHEADALEFLSLLAHGAAGDFDAIHASPPCQDHSAARVLNGAHGTGWMLMATRDKLAGMNIPWVVENVKTAPLPRQDDLFGAYGLELCGCMFPGLRGQLYEARVFEMSFGIAQPPHRRHVWPVTKMGRPPKTGECMQMTGHFSDVPEGRQRMGIDWMMTQDEVAQAIPPDYTEYIGTALMEQVNARR